MWFPGYVAVVPTFQPSTIYFKHENKPTCLNRMWWFPLLPQALMLMHRSVGWLLGSALESSPVPSSSGTPKTSPPRDRKEEQQTGGDVGLLILLGTSGKPLDKRKGLRLTPDRLFPSWVWAGAACSWTKCLFMAGFGAEGGSRLAQKVSHLQPSNRRGHVGSLFSVR